jgi:SAM-dependent methyltransferase
MDTSASLGAAEPSPWVSRWVPLIRVGGRVLDLACGSGRHTRLLARLGYRVEAVDRDVAVLGGAGHLPGVSLRQADLENGPWPYRGEKFDGIVVTNYLHRPLLPVLLASLDSGGVLIYETFALGNEKFGRPRNPAFLLRPGELRELVRGRLKIVAYEETIVTEPRPAQVQRICAVVDGDGISPQPLKFSPAGSI